MTFFAAEVCFAGCAKLDQTQRRQERIETTLTPYPRSTVGSDFPAEAVREEEEGWLLGGGDGSRSPELEQGGGDEAVAVLRGPRKKCRLSRVKAKKREMKNNNLRL